MTNHESDSASFEVLSCELLNAGFSVRFEARGASMSPCIRDGQIVHVTPVIVSKLRKGDIVLTKGHSGFRVHRLVITDHSKNLFITRGDCGLQNDPPVSGDQILGIVLTKEVKLGKKFVRTNLKGIGGKLLQAAARGQSVAGKLLRRAVRPSSGAANRANAWLGALGLILFLLAATSSRAQVLVDTNPSTNATADLVGAGTQTLTITHTTSATANRALLVGVSINIANSPSTAVTGITYNGTALTLVGAHNDAGNTRRMEMWYLLNPASGTNLPIIVSVNVPTAATVGVTAGATVFTDVDQTVPLGTFVDADGAAATNSQLDVPSVINGMVFDTLAVGMGAITVNGPQVTQWNVASGGAASNATQDVVGTASSRTGAPSVPISESFNGALNLTSAAPSKTVTLNLTNVAPTTVALTLTKATAGFGNTVYTGTITGGGGNAYAGDTVVVTGFTSAADNGTFACTASTATTITLSNNAGVTQTHAGTATVTTSTVYTGTITGGAGNAFNGDAVTIAGFVNAGNNGTFTISASSATTLTVNNKASVAETDPGTATVTTGATTHTVYTGTITGGTGNGFAGDSFVIAGFGNAGNNGTFTCTASTATTLTCPNTAGVAQTGTATATTNATFNWSLGAVSINPTAANLGVTTSVGSAVFLGSNTTYTITISNSGTSAANAVSLSDTLASGMTLVSVTPSVGSCVTSANPVTCSIGTLASGANATVTVVETASAAGSYANTAVVSDSGVPPDQDTANNTFIAVATVQSPACATVTQAVPNNSVSGTVNTYYPGTASVAAGATSIPVGTATGGGSAIAAGNLLLIIQMQDASINDSNNVAYGNGYTGQGFTSLNSAGDYEFVTAQSPLTTSGGSVTISGAGLGGGTVFAYHASAATGSAGQSTYQVIVVPQYTTATFNATTPPTALAWNGSTGGVLVLDTSSTLTLNGATIVMDGLGFRGGAGLQLSGIPNPAPPILPATTDYEQPAPATYNPAADGQPGWDAPKGEGIAGTPAWVESGGTFLATGTGYPSGAAGALALTSVANAAGGDTVYTGTITGGAANAWAGYTFVVGGFANAANNGRFVSTASTATTLTLTNAAGAAQTGTATANLDGSMGRGAPGNAGGGATDGDPATASAGGNDMNAGGGGGGNGGAGGFGGDSWNNNLSVGGEGGALFPATINRVAMGGGGGGGTRNNSNGDNQASGGATGGGIIIIRTYALSGTATLTANGVSAYNLTANDAGGGGGAGGTIVVLSANGGESGLTLQANGGNGGDAWASNPYTLGNRHGPGGGGGGGVVLVSGTPASISVTGGASGTTENPGVTYGSTNGAAGTSATNESISQTSGTQSGAECTPDMTLAKNNSGIFTRGSTASYTIPVTNVSPDGPSSGTVTVNDTLPVGLTPINTSGTGAGWSCSIAGQTVSCTNSTALAGAATYPSIVINVNVLQTAPSSVTNIATVSGGSEINLTNDTATNTANVISSADLSVTNAASPNPVAAGANLTFAQLVTNNGPSAADNATLVEAVPANTTFVSLSAPVGWTCTLPSVGGTGNVVCTNLNMVGGTAATFSMVVTVNSGTANGTVITGTTTVSSSVSDPNSANNVASASTVVGTTAGAEMTVTNSASPNPVIAGNDITYTQTATNVGSSTATAPTLSDTTPPNTTFVSISTPPGTTCTPLAVGATGTTTCTGASAPAGTSGTVVFIVKVTAGTASGTVINDTVTVNATNQAFGANSAVATDVVATATQSDLALSTVATPLSVIAGNDISYTQTVTNNGPAAATNAQFVEATPANTTFASVSAPVGWTCTTPAVGAAGNVTCTDPSMASGTSADIIVVVNLASTVTAASITATSTVSSTTTDPNTANNSTTTVTPVAEACDLAVTNSGTPSPVTVNTDITYTQVVTNSGPSNCSTASFTEAFPANTTFVSLTPVPAGWSCTTTGSINCTDPTFAPGTTSTFPVIVKVTGGTLITDTVTVATTTRDTNTANNTATVTTGVATNTEADLSITNTASPSPVTAGSNITYTQVVTNNGPATATTLVLTDTLPTGTTLSSLSGTGWTCVTTTTPYTCKIASLAINTSATVTFVVTVSPTATAGSTISDTASIASSVTDPNINNNSATAVVGVADSANLSISNAASPVPVQAGNNITYTQVVTNSGPSVATAATITEVTPPNTTFFSIGTPPAGWSCTTPSVGNTGTITCTNPSFAVGTASFSIAVTVIGTATAGTAINDTATVTSSTTDPNLANNSATASDVVATNTEADLVATNSASPTTVAAGSNVSYTQSVTNNGPAAATSVTFTQTTPPNTNFQSITPPAGWVCTKPAVGAAGTITCTDVSSLALNASASFTLVLQVNSATASGTNIAETVTANASNIVPNSTSNSATATVVVANANSADMAIVKTATPSPTVASGDTLTYTLQVTNNGPASATDVTVTDPLPSDVTFLSVNTTAGTCSEAGGTVTCLLGTMAASPNPTDTATVTILTLAGAPGVVTNTATVSADQSDPVLTNNSSTWPETITAATKIGLQSFAAQRNKDKTGSNRVVLYWKTGGEAHNLGFNVYREQNGERVQLNPSLIAGSALMMRGTLPKHTGKTYTWIDSSPASSGAYWLEDVDTNGTRTLHGPVQAEAAASTPSASDAAPAAAPMLNQLNQILNQAQPAATIGETSHPRENISQSTRPSAAQYQQQLELAANPAVKILLKHEGWYQVTQPELVAAGLNPNVDPALLHLYAEAIEQPMEITGASAGSGGFGPQAAISFYGTGIDTPYSGTRVYWLAVGESQGARIQQLPPSTGSNQPPASFPFTIELTPHTTYFSALTTSNGNNFFGPVISSTAIDETMHASHIDTTAAEPAQLEVVLQGIILAIPHDVTVALNGTTLGDVTFTGEAKGTFSVTLPPGLLQDGDNTVTFASQDGEYDLSLVQSIRITYPHTYAADSDSLIFSGRPGDELKVSGFVQAPVAVLDITNPDQPMALTPQIVSETTSNPSQYAIVVQVPWSTTAPSAPARHTLLAVAQDRVASAMGIRQNHPSHWHSAQRGSEIVMVSPADFADALSPLIQAHEKQGKSAVVVPVDQLYDEFTFGQHSPYAIREFLKASVKTWHTAPRYLLLNGRASLDPRNYLGFGHLDFVPTKIVPTSMLVTASDDWFSDFNDSGMPTIATGRLPVSTPAEAQLVANKIATYEGKSTNGPWTSQALMVADVNDTIDFTQDSTFVQKQLPSTIQVTDVFAGTMTIPQAQQEILSAINAGQLLVNYAGHGSEEQWSGDNLFNNTVANSLTNGSSLPVFLIMDCLNGFFQDVYDVPLAVTLMLAPNGGAVAVLASSGLNQAGPQTNLDKLVVQGAMTSPQPPLGDAILKAKSGITDLAVRKTYNLLGDPAMQIKAPTAH